MLVPVQVRNPNAQIKDFFTLRCKLGNDFFSLKPPSNKVGNHSAWSVRQNAIVVHKTRQLPWWKHRANLCQSKMHSDTQSRTALSDGCGLFNRIPSRQERRGTENTIIESATDGVINRMRNSEIVRVND